MSFQENLSAVLEALRWTVDDSNFRQVDQALADSFKALTPWAARIVVNSQQQSVWSYTVDQTLLRLLACLSPEHWARLSDDQVKMLRRDQRSAERYVKMRELQASIWAKEHLAHESSISKMRRVIALGSWKSTKKGQKQTETRIHDENKV